VHRPKYINVGGKLLDLSVPKVMGILNITPDSFYSGSRTFTEKEVLSRASQMVKDGADILDVGGYSSRPGAEEITQDEEIRRILPTIRMIRNEFPDAVISVDTFRSEIAHEAVKNCGAGMINDISGGDGDEDMFKTVSELNVPYIMMHMKGTPRTMQTNPEYDDVVSDILKWAGVKITALRSKGVNDIIFDPGFGFGKTIDHNFEMLRRLTDFSITGLPLLIGISRKSMIWKTLSTTPEGALNGTTALNSVALLNGADILRVHDVKEAVETIALIEKIKYSGLLLKT
jgi:dihydropteroate synthase